MANSKQKLELTWIGKNNPEYDIANIEPRILEERTDLSYGDPNSENMIIHGDNLLALKALLPEYEGKIKCIYIDPPYNTGNAFEHYDDSVEHSTWLSLMKPRLELLRLLLSEDGSIWITLDDNEVHYFKIMCDEIFGRNSFITSISWRISDNSNNNVLTFSEDHNNILVYSKKTIWKPKFLNDDKRRTHFKNPDNDPKGSWFDGNPVNNPGWRPNLQFNITGPFGDMIKHPPNGWRWSKETIDEKLSTGELRFSVDGKRLIRRTYLNESEGLPPSNLWIDLEETGHNRQAKYELKALFPERKVTDLFSTPKPEKLIKRIIDLATNPSDLVLDSFLGSGTTAAVAHKMGRKYIGIEMGDHAYTHCKVRLDKIIDGKDQGGISKALEWKGGGGYKFYELAPSFVAIDEFGNPIIDSYYNDTKLIRAMCKLTNYTFAPNPADYWKQGKGQGNNSIYVTTQMLSVAMVQQIVSHLDTHETLLICPKKFEPGCEKVDNRITIKKIPQSILKACQFGKKEYLLPIKERTIEEIDEEELIDDQA